MTTLYLSSNLHINFFSWLTFRSFQVLFVLFFLIFVCCICWYEQCFKRHSRTHILYYMKVNIQDTFVENIIEALMSNKLPSIALCIHQQYTMCLYSHSVLLWAFRFILVPLFLLTYPLLLDPTWS